MDSPQPIEPALGPPSGPVAAEPQLARIEMVETGVNPEPLTKRERAAAKSSSAMWVPLKAPTNPLIRFAHLLLPSGWALLLAGVMLAWRVLALHARGDLLVAPERDLLLGALCDVGLAQILCSTLRLLSAAPGLPLSPTADITRNGSLMLAFVWAGATLLRLAGLVASALDKKPIEPAFWSALVQDPLAWLLNGAVITALVVAFAVAAVARFCLTCDMEIAQALSDAEPRWRFVGGTAITWLAAVGVVAGVAHAAGQLPAKSAARVPELQAMTALSHALHDPTLRRGED